MSNSIGYVIRGVLFYTATTCAAIDYLAIPVVVIEDARLGDGWLIGHDTYATARRARCGLCSMPAVLTMAEYGPVLRSAWRC